jgi:hypothetical protein
MDESAKVMLFCMLALPLCVAVTIYKLSMYKPFLQSSMGRYMFVTRDFYDLNQTAIPWDSTGPDSELQQVLEVLAKNVTGHVLPKLRREAKSNDITDATSNTDADARPTLADADFEFVFSPPATRIPLFKDKIIVPEVTYWSYCKDDKSKLFGSTESEKMANLHEIGLYHVYVDYTKEAQRDVRTEATNSLLMFNKPFLKMFKLRDARASFHTFGNDTKLLQHALAALGKTSRKFVVTYTEQCSFYACPQLDVASYTEVTSHDMYHGRTLNESAFVALRDSSENKDVVFIVQEDYARWKGNKKTCSAGKLAALRYRPFQVARGLIFDDVACWQMRLDAAPAHNLLPFVHVNSIHAALTENYFIDAAKKFEQSIFTTSGFWEIFVVCTFSILGVTYVFDLFLALMAVLTGFVPLLFFKQTESE